MKVQRHIKMINIIRYIVEGGMGRGRVPGGGFNYRRGGGGTLKTDFRYLSDDPVRNRGHNGLQGAGPMAHYSSSENQQMHPVRN